MDLKHNNNRQDCLICAVRDVPPSHFNGRRHFKALERQASVTLVCNDCNLGPGSFVNRVQYESHFSSRFHLIQSRLRQGFTLPQISLADGVGYYYCDQCNYFSEVDQAQHEMGSRHHVRIDFIFPVSIFVIYSFCVQAMVLRRQLRANGNRPAPPDPQVKLLTSNTSSTHSFLSLASSNPTSCVARNPTVSSSPTSAALSLAISRLESLLEYERRRQRCRGAHRNR